LRNLDNSEIQNRFVALENVDDNMDIDRAWEIIRRNIKVLTRENLGYYELRLYRAQCDEQCSKYYMKEEAKLQWM
jgi:hypothetical protein